MAGDSHKKGLFAPRFAPRCKKALKMGTIKSRHPHDPKKIIHCLYEIAILRKALFLGVFLCFEMAKNSVRSLHTTYTKMRFLHHVCTTIALRNYYSDLLLIILYACTPAIPLRLPFPSRFSMVLTSSGEYSASISLPCPAVTCFSLTTPDTSLVTGHISCVPCCQNSVID